MFKKLLFFLTVMAVTVPQVNIHAAAPESSVVVTSIQLDEARIEQIKIKLAKDFDFRSYLAKGTKVVGVATMLWMVYRLGFFDDIIKYLFPGKQKQEILSKDFADKLAELGKKIAALEAKSVGDPIVKKEVLSSGGTLINGVKSFGSNAISIIAWLIINTKIQNFYEYVFAKPSFEWFFTHHSVIATIDGVRRHLQVITDLNVPAEYSIEYHNRALNPALQSIARTLEELIAFLEYYLERIDQDVVYEQAMDTLPRYIFNIGNDFFKKIENILHGSADQSNAMALVNDFKADITNAIHRCRIFEKEFLAED